jgi:phosphoribosyl-AMP cyclohydrolase / phosphoribosyl-ATP pyrophosphohydrolase
VNELNPDFAKQGGLVPAIVQDADSGQVLMLGYMNEAALQATRDKGLVTFFSRSKGRLWTKGESSGHVLRLVSMALDCDADALLVEARAEGPTCHLGSTSCFGEARSAGMLGRLDALIAQRVAERPEGSYTSRLLEAGLPRMAQKVGEEGVETALAAVTGDADALAGEAADLLYHLLVLLRARGLGLAEVQKVLADRHAAPPS